MNLEKFNSLLDKLIEQEQIKANEKLKSVKEELSKQIITTNLNVIIEDLELLRLLPLYYQGGIKSREELEFYKKVKLRKIEKQIEAIPFRSQISCQIPECSLYVKQVKEEILLRDKNRLNKLNEDKKFIETIEWDGENIILNDQLECNSFLECREIEKVFTSDIKELDENLKFFNCELCKNGYWYAMLAKIIESDTVFSKYLYYINFVEEFKKLQQKGIHAFSFSQTKHLKFLESFFSMYPFVSEKLFRKSCDDSRVNEFCDNEDVNKCPYNWEMVTRERQGSSNYDDYDIYIASNPMVKKAYDKYYENYSPYQNAEDFLKFKEEEFEYFSENYKRDVSRFRELLAKVLNNIPSNELKISADFDFRILNKYRNFDNSYEIDNIFKLQESIKNFEVRYNLSNLALVNWNNQTFENLIDSIIEEIKGEFITLRKELRSIQQELKELYDTYDKMYSNFNLLLFEEKELSEMEQIILESFGTEIKNSDLEKYMKFDLQQVSDIETLSFGYSVVLIDLILARCFPNVREFYYRDSSNKYYDYINCRINHDSFKGFSSKIKLLDKM